VSEIDPNTFFAGARGNEERANPRVNDVDLTPEVAVWLSVVASVALAGAAVAAAVRRLRSSAPSG